MFRKLFATLFSAAAGAAPVQAQDTTPQGVPPGQAHPAASEGETVQIGTDVAGLFIFHPDDLKHRADNPIAWYAYDFAFARESAAGNLIGFSTTSDGGYTLRLTQGPLTRDETQFAGPNLAFPYEVRHGRVYVDNSDGLPGVEQMDQPDEFPDRWVEMPNGKYRVVVTGIDRAQPGAPADLPVYVVRFEAVDSLAAVPPLAGYPEIEPLKGASVNFWPFGSADFDHWGKAKPVEAQLKILVVPAETMVFPGVNMRLDMTEAEAGKFDGDSDRYALVFHGGQIAAVGEITGMSTTSGRGSTVSWRVEAPIDFLSVPEGDLVKARITPKPDMTAPVEQLADFKRVILELVAGKWPDSFEQERFEALQDPEAITSLALQHLPLSGVQRLSIYRHGAAERIALIRSAFANEKRRRQDAPAFQSAVCKTRLILT